ncbi:type IV pilus assembly protein PilV [Oxalobacteraceae bacterium GrIS 2.11]
MFMKPHQIKPQSGVSLIEVLISLLVIAVGVLGMAKMQALAVSSTQTSGARALIALQANSLAALMHSDKGFWQVKTGTPNCAAASCTLSGTSTTIFGTVPTACSFTSLCLPGPMVAYDINNWMNSINSFIPTYSANINCSGGGTASPVNCAISISWFEKQQGGSVTTATVAQTTPSVKQTYFLYVQP